MFEQKNIGIWGFGVVGKAAFNFFYPRAKLISILESKKISNTDHPKLYEKKVKIIQQLPEMDLTSFFEDHDFIIISPGIDSSPYEQYRHKIIAEVDIFQSYFTRSVIGITGSVGKTSVTTLLTTALNQNGSHALAAGNIGTGMLNCFQDQENLHYAVLELSSFQLEYATSFAPHLAIITNWYPNHLDRHKTKTAYFNAKMGILRNQRAEDFALIPFGFLHNSRYQIFHRKNHAFFSAIPLTNEQIKSHNDKILFWIDDDKIFMYQNGFIKQLISVTALPQFSFQENWIIIVAALTLLKQPLNLLKNISSCAPNLEHRLEYLIRVNDIAFYNDSKATVPQSTLAAINVLQPGPIILFLGGISKGIDRSSFVACLKEKIEYVYCFGSESEHLAFFCKSYQINASAHATLQEAFQECIKKNPRSCSILFSPAGASYDLFADYKERGACFKKLVDQYARLHGHALK